MVVETSSLDQMKEQKSKTNLLNVPFSSLKRSLLEKNHFHPKGKLIGQNDASPNCSNEKKYLDFVCSVQKKVTESRADF